MLAVFERIDLGLVERLLAVATEESSLAFVSFVNQSARKDSVPEAAISANFRYIFETKTTRDALDAVQLESHLSMLDGRFASERLLVLTPDAETPTQVTDPGVEWVIWLSVDALSGAIDSLHALASLNSGSCAITPKALSGSTRTFFRPMRSTGFVTDAWMSGANTLLYIGNTRVYARTNVYPWTRR